MPGIAVTGFNPWQEQLIQRLIQYKALLFEGLLRLHYGEGMNSKEPRLVRGLGVDKPAPAPGFNQGHR